MTEVVVALLMFLNGNMIEHTYKESMSNCLKGKRIAMRTNTSRAVNYQCIKSMAELESNIDGSKSIKKLILE